MTHNCESVLSNSEENKTLHIKSDLVQAPITKPVTLPSPFNSLCYENANKVVSLKLKNCIHSKIPVSHERTSTVTRFILRAEHLPGMGKSWVQSISTAINDANKLFIRTCHHRPSNLSATLSLQGWTYSLEPGTKLTLPSSNGFCQIFCHRNKKSD